MNRKRLTTEQFVERAKKIHVDKYDYIKTITTSLCPSQYFVRSFLKPNVL